MTSGDPTSNSSITTKSIITIPRRVVVLIIYLKRVTYNRACSHITFYLFYNSKMYQLFMSFLLTWIHILINGGWWQLNQTPPELESIIYSLYVIIYNIMSLNSIIAPKPLTTTMLSIQVFPYSHLLLL